MKTHTITAMNSDYEILKRHPEFCSGKIRNVYKTFIFGLIKIKISTYIVGVFKYTILGGKNGIHSATNKNDNETIYVQGYKKINL